MPCWDSTRARKDRALRTRTLAAIFKAAPDGKLILPALEAFPLDYRFEPQEFRDEILTPLITRPGFETRRPFFRALESKSPIARLIAVLGLERMGFHEDGERIVKLAKDPGAVKGLPASEGGVGPQARRAAAALRKTAPPNTLENIQKEKMKAQRLSPGEQVRSPPVCRGEGQREARQLVRGDRVAVRAHGALYHLDLWPGCSCVAGSI